MTDNDMDLVREYAARQSEPAFAELASRHVNLVYSTALRQAGDPSLAEEITQAVFIILARKAGSLGATTILPSWLYRTTCYAAKDALRTQRRRQHREQEAYMQSTLQEAPTDTAWEQLAPALDEAMTRLGQDDRDALVLRFFENRSLQEIGAAIGTSEDAAKKRVSRALEKLRKYFLKRGVVVPAAVLTAVISANSVQAAPAMLAKAATAVALAKSAATGGSTLAMVKGTLKVMAWAKAKTATAVTAGVLLAAGATTVVATLEKNSIPSSPDAIYEKLWASTQMPDPDTARTAALFKSAPPALIVRPTRYADAVGSTWIRETRKGCAANVTVPQLVEIAYQQHRMTFSGAWPGGSYDFMGTLPDRENVLALQEEIKTQFGLVGRREIRTTNVLVLTVKDPAKLRQYLSKKRGSTITRFFQDQKKNLLSFHFRNLELDGLAHGLEDLLQSPVVDHSGVTNRYDVNFQLDQAFSMERGRQSIRGQILQFGLELKSGHEAVEMLVVERIK